MGIFSRKKDRKNHENKIDAAFNRVYSRIGKIDSWDDPKKLEHYILDSCEQIIASTKEMERQKTEYRVVSKYLNDIKVLEELPEDMGTDLRNTASRIIDLEKSITNSKQIKRNISEEQFQVIAEEESEMPMIINRLSADEKYQSKVKKDMNFLEGEKGRWEIERDNLKNQNKLLHKLSLCMLAFFITVMIVLFAINNSGAYDCSTLMLVVFLLCFLVGALIYFKQTDIKHRNHVAIIRLNQAISVLNVQRMKFVNVTNGIEFQKDKYTVESALELQYVWQQYIDTIKDQERYIKNNQDLEYYNEKLIRLLSKIDLHDRKIWISQVNALVEKDDMAQVRHKLVKRRQKIRARIEDNKRIIQNERDEIDRLMVEHQHYLPEIQEIISSVDKLCNTSSKLASVNK